MVVPTLTSVGASTCSRCQVPIPPLRETPNFCPNCSWPVRQPCPYEELGCPGLLPVSQGVQRLWQCPSCHRPVEYGEFGRALKLGDARVQERRLRDWGSRFGPGNARCMSLDGEVGLLEPTQAPLQVSIHGAQVVDCARSAGQFHVALNVNGQGQIRSYTPAKTGWEPAPPVVLSFPVRGLTAAGWHAWATGPGMTMYIDLLRGVQVPIPVPNAWVLSANALGESAFCEGSNLYWFNGGTSVRQQRLPLESPPVAAFESEGNWTVVALDGAIYSGAAGELRLSGASLHIQVRGAAKTGGDVFLHTVDPLTGAGEIRALVQSVDSFVLGSRLPYEGAFEPALSKPTAYGPMVIGWTLGTGAKIHWRNRGGEDAYAVTPGYTVKDLLMIEGTSQGRPKRLTIWIQDSGRQYELRVHTPDAGASFSAVPLGARPQLARLMGTEEGLMVAVYDSPSLIVHRFGARTGS